MIRNDKRCSSCGGSFRSKHGGFTLLETVITLILIGIGMGLAAHVLGLAVDVIQQRRLSVDAPTLSVAGTTPFAPNCLARIVAHHASGTLPSLDANKDINNYAWRTYSCDGPVKMTVTCMKVGDETSKTASKTVVTPTNDCSGTTSRLVELSDGSFTVHQIFTEHKK